jgi:hypothetical protein
MSIMSNEYSTRAILIGNDANQPDSRHFNTGKHSVSDMDIRALSGSNDNRKSDKPHQIKPRGSGLQLIITVYYLE